MDEIKDISKKEAPLLDSKDIRTQPFGRNITGARSYARAERIAAAIHLVTGHISPEEPVRRHVRESAIVLLSALIQLRDEMRISTSAALKHSQATIRELVSLVRVLVAASFVSVQNADALIEALDELGTFLVTSQRSSLSETVSLSKEDLVATGPFQSDSQTAKKRPHHRIGGRRTLALQMSNRADRSKAREVHVLAVLRAQGQLGIKDISANLPQYSEKMLQRELKALVAKGQVRKSGSKRWSLYSLAQ